MNTIVSCVKYQFIYTETVAFLDSFW